RHHTYLRTEVLGVGSHLPQGLGRGAKQQVVEYSLVLQRQRRQFVWQGEDDVVILDRQERLGLTLEPGRVAASLALGAMAIATGIVADEPGAAVVALLDVAAQRGGAAACQRRQSTA